jgi:2-polyprenyl-3-methyl-5-hydroxy-6-metoxy-1,4-benzoquinol methylase
VNDATAEFYDGLSEDYHLVYADWDASIRRQAAALDRLIRERTGRPHCRILDCTCGIGTQSLGLAALGHDVVGTDLSPRAIERARHEAHARGLSIRFEVADLRSLSLGPGEAFDVVLSADNSLPHLIYDEDLRAGVDRMVAHIEPGGLFLASIRDYDALLEAPPTATLPVVRGDAGDRSVTFQLWQWDAVMRVYTLEMFVLREQADGSWHSSAHRTRYRALRRSELTEVLRGSGLEDIEWLMPDDSGFFQPIVMATLP